MNEGPGDLLTLPIHEVLPATSRAAIVRIDLQGRSFPFQAGQALVIGTHGQDIRQPYSIANAPEDATRDGWLELLIGVTQGAAGPHLDLTPGALVDIAGPLGRFTFPAAPTERRLLFVAGGTGISPLRSMYRHALALGWSTIGVLYSARTPDDFAYEGELRQLARDGRIELELTVTRESDDRWSGSRGRINAALLGRLLHDPETLCFICGPRALVDEIPRALGSLGVGAQRVRIEEW